MQDRTHCQWESFAPEQDWEFSYGLSEYADVSPFLFKQYHSTSRPKASLSQHRSRNKQAQREHLLATRIVARLKAIGL
jgi:hypothetical protein